MRRPAGAACAACAVLAALAVHGWSGPPRPRLVTALAPVVLPVQAAPRAWVGLAAGRVLFLEKSPPPARYLPGSWLEVLYTMAPDGTTATALAELGLLDVAPDKDGPPLVDAGGRRVWTACRMRDTDGDGLVTPADAARLLSVDIAGGMVREWFLPAARPRPLAATADGRVIAVANTTADGDELYEIEPGDGGRRDGDQRRIARKLPRLAEARYDRRGKLFTRATGDTAWQAVLDGKCRPMTASMLLWAADGSELLRDATGGLTRTARGTVLWRLAAPLSRWLFPLAPAGPVTRDVFLDETPGACRLFAADVAGKKREDLYVFPGHTTRLAAAPDGLSCAFLLTWDTDENGTLDPAGRDKSAAGWMKVAVP